MATIYDIAKETGFSASTVARALNGKGYCSATAKEIILRAAEELNYVPFQAAKTLKNNITKKVMMCIPDIQNPYYFAMIHGATQVLEKSGYNILLSYTMHSPGKELEVLDSLRGHFVDGVIFGSFNYTPKLARALQDTGLPAVITSYYKSPDNLQAYDCVYVNQPEAGWTATSYCLRYGHSRIAFVGGSPRNKIPRSATRAIVRPWRRRVSCRSESSQSMPILPAKVPTVL